MAKREIDGRRRRERGAATLGTVAALALPTIALGICCLAKPQERKEPPADMPATKYYKNVKVMKDVKANQLLPVMHEFNRSLGVKCDFCHEQDRALDTKPTKIAARKMWIMSKDINKKYDVVKGMVSCYTCHRGSPEPENRPQQ